MKLFFILLFSLPLNAFAESAIVFGKDFKFSFQIPAGWECHCDGKEAAKISANAVLFRKGSRWQQSETIIFFRVNSAIDDKVEEDVKADIVSYQRQYPKSQVKSLKVEHSKYKAAGTLFEIPAKAFEYVTYLAPQPFPGKNISVAMNVQKRAGNSEEMGVYQEVTKSITWLDAKK